MSSPVFACFSAMINVLFKEAKSTTGFMFSYHVTKGKNLEVLQESVIIFHALFGNKFQLIFSEVLLN